MTTPTDAAARGAAWLDERKPDWYRDIDVGTLVLQNPCRCVLAQIGGTYATVLHWLWQNDHWGRDAWAYALGFNAAGDCGDFSRYYAALDEAWIAEVKARWEHGDIARVEREGTGG